MSGAERSRRFRQRRGVLVVLPVEFDRTAVIEAMIEGGLLSEAESTNKKAVSRALAEVVNRYRKDVTRCGSKR
jgi:RIO-like serine/threonine protein kinase